MVEPAPSGWRKYTHIAQKILLSGNPAAYFVAAHFGLQLVLAPVDWILSKLERPRDVDLQFAPIFVIGIHRTGSTFVSQVFEQVLDVAPIGNAVALFPRSTGLAHRILRKFRKAGPVRKLHNYYGISPGLLTIGDCYEFWDLFFGSDHYQRPASIDERRISSLRTTIARLSNSYGAAMLAKNNRNTLLADVLYRAFPQSLFVLITRDPAEVVRSTLAASEDFFSGRSLWGLVSQKYNASQYVSLQDAALDQYTLLSREVSRVLDRVPAQNVFRLPYESFCEDPQSTIREVVQRVEDLSGIRVRVVGEMPTGFRARRSASSDLKRLVSSALQKRSTSDA